MSDGAGQRAPPAASSEEGRGEETAEGIGRPEPRRVRANSYYSYELFVAL